MLTITIPPQEDLWNPVTEEFVSFPGKTITLEHSLVSLSKWESIWHKPFLMKQPEKTTEELLSYIKCMTVTQNVNDTVYEFLTVDNVKDIVEYMENPMTATTITDNSPPSREIITSEIIYYDMIALNIPIKFEKWHLNRLLTLIRVCSIKSQPQKKMSDSEILARNYELNMKRRAKLGTKG